MEPLIRSTFPADWITLVLFGSLLFLALAKRLYYSRFLNFIILPFNNKYVLMYNKKERLFNWFNLLLAIFLVLNASLFLYLSRSLWQQPDEEVFPFLYLIIAAFILGYLLAKNLLQLANAYLFGNKGVIVEYMFKKSSYLFYSGILLFIANVLLVYVIPFDKVMIYSAISLFILINMAGWVNIVKNHQNYIANKFFYFILYLCALEIAPLVVILSALTQ